MSGAVRGKYVAGGGGGGGGGGDRSCYVCGVLGHLARDCCRRAVVEGSGPVCCFVCGKPGHVARYCYKRARPKRGSGGGRSTSLCREQGRLATNCVGVAREPGDSSRRVGAIAVEISHSSSSDDDNEVEKRVLVESMNNGRRGLLGPHGVVCKNSTGSLNATVRMEEEKDDDDDDDCIILDYNPFQPQNKFSRSDRYLSGLRNKGISVVSEQGQLALSSGDAIRKEISFLSSYEDDDDDDYDADNDEEEVMVGKKSTGFVNAEVRVKKEKMREEDWEDDESCIILDFDPFQPPTADFEHKLSLSDHFPSGLQNEDIFVISERGQVACRDYPHSRYHCAKYPFSKSDHESYCPQCYCYVCDIVAPCEHWKGSNGHCHASDDDWAWMVRRMLHKHNVT